MHATLNRLLRSNINPWQIAAYALANLVGLLIVGIGLQFYRDVNTGRDRDDEIFDTRNYMLVSRPTRASLFGSSSAGEITDSDIAGIAAQPWAASAAPFTPAGFNVSVSLDFAGRSFGTELFLEGVPDRYFEHLPEGWDFDPADPSVAIILPRNYLTLYNLGYAPARSLPRLDEKIVSMATLSVTVTGNGRTEVLPGRIVGFSSRINTIAVPADFMQWANQRYSTDQPATRRVIVEVSDAGNPAISHYLTDHNLEENNTDDASARMHFIVKITTAVIASIGLLISLLAVGMLVLSVFLLLQKNRAMLADLIQLGYTRSSLGNYYIRLVATVNVAVLVSACAGVAACSTLWRPLLAGIGPEGASLLITIVTLTTVMLLITLISAAIIRGVLRRI